MTKPQSSDHQSALAQEGKIAREVWEHFGDELRRRELSHWRGTGKYKDDQRWINIGRKTVATLDMISKMTGSPWWVKDRRLRVLEWGPGGGSNAHAIGSRATDYYGVDISEPNLNEAARMLGMEGINTFRPIHLVDRINQVRTSVADPIDVFFSTAVFQHFPSKEYAAAVMEEIETVCAPGAIGFIQIRYEDGRFPGVNTLSDYNKNFVTATSFEIGEFAKLCRRVGFSILFMCDINENVNYLTFCLRVARRV